MLNEKNNVSTVISKLKERGFRREIDGDLDPSGNILYWNEERGIISVLTLNYKRTDFEKLTCFAEVHNNDQVIDVVGFNSVDYGVTPIYHTTNETTFVKCEGEPEKVLESLDVAYNQLNFCSAWTEIPPRVSEDMSKFFNLGFETIIAEKIPEEARQFITGSSKGSK